MKKILLVAMVTISLAMVVLGCGDDDSNGDTGGGAGVGGSITENEFMDICVPFITECDGEADDDMTPEQYCQASYNIQGEHGGEACQRATADFYACIQEAGCEDGTPCSTEVTVRTEVCH